MRLAEILGIIREYFSLALLAVVVLGVIFFLLYFIILKRFFRDKKVISKKKLLLLGLFIGYMIMVIGVTFLNRGSNYQGGIELSLFSSYREAWYSFKIRLWQFIYLNIFMLVPFGLLFPLLHPRFKKSVWTIGAAALFTLSIECFQLITGYGIFEVDDLFNNLLGAMIGYGITMGLITMKEKGIKQSLVYLSPLLLVIILSVGIFTYYHLKEFGNLSIVPSHKVDMGQADITTDVNFNNKSLNVPIYKAPSFTKDAADEFVRNFFEKMQIDTSNMEDISYPDEGMYRIFGENSYDLSFLFLDGSYRFLDFSILDDGIKPQDADEETLAASLSKFGVEIPQEAKFQKVDTGIYEWTVDNKTKGSQLIDGVLTVNYYSDHTVKEFWDQLITYDKVKDVQIKSEQEAYHEVLKGKFQFFSGNDKIDTLQIHKVEISYFLDSKGYYQPVYAFESTLNGMDMTILVPGM